MAQILKHSLDEIKPQRTKLFNPVSTMQRLNRALEEIVNFDGDDDCMREYLVNHYLKSLDLYHINGRAGSLLPKIKERKIINLANILYDAYARLTPTGFIADANQEAVAAVRLANVAALRMAAQ